MPARALALPALAVLAALAGCSTPPPPDRDDHAALPAPGSDRDAHGCIGSAGYAWCEGTGQCERPWELARAKGFDNTAAAFAAWCRNPPATTP